jgi:transposase
MAETESRLEQRELPLPMSGVEDAIVINDRCALRVEQEHRVVVVAGVVVAHFADDDPAERAYAMVSLVERGWADQNDVARAFDVSARTVRRCQRRYDDAGIVGLGRGPGYPSGRPRAVLGERTLRRLKGEGHSNRVIAHRLGISEKAVRKRLRRLGWKPPPAPEQRALPLASAAPAGADPNLSASSSAPPQAPPEPASAAPAGADPNLSASSSAPPQAPPEPASSAPPGADPNLSASSSAPPQAPPEPASSAPPGADPNLSASSSAPPRTPLEPASSAPPGADPNLSASSSAPVATPAATTRSADTDPMDRRFDRFLAHMGLLDDAVPLFASALRVPNAGVLLALPSLVASGVLDAADRVYGSIGPAFYGLRTTLLTLLFMALWRIKRPEGLKERSPPELGRVLGLDRAPEVKTVRRKLTRLSRIGGAERLGRLVAERRVASLGQALGLLYVDGHVRVYHGKRELPKAHVTRLRISMPATTDYWVNDQRGDPLFVVTAEANAGLTKVLPKLLDDVRGVVGERRVTLVFDRGGWSPKLFQKLIARGFDILTYRKGRIPPVPEAEFTEHEGEIDGRIVRYQLADQKVSLLKGKLLLRQVTRLSNGHQTHVITSRTDLSALDVAHRMFERWRQENFFKYMREELLLDALVDYQIEPDDAERDVPNPVFAALDVQRRAARGEISRLQAEYGEAALHNPEQRRPSMRGFKIAHATLAKKIQEQRRHLLDLEQARAAVPRRIPVGQRTAGEVIKLSTERKHLTNVLKMIAYQAESDLLRAVTPHYKRAEDEGRTLLHAAFASAADLEVTATELRVTLAPQSSAHRSKAVAALCDALNASTTTFPGTTLALRYAVAEPLPAPSPTGR